MHPVPYHMRWKAQMSTVIQRLVSPPSMLRFLHQHPRRRDLFHFWVVDSTCSVNLTAFRSDFASFDPLRAHLVWVVWVLTCVGAATLRLPFHMYMGT
jgi:hypothetical protein